MGLVVESFVCGDNELEEGMCFRKKKPSGEGKMPIFVAPGSSIRAKNSTAPDVRPMSILKIVWTFTFARLFSIHWPPFLLELKG